MHKEVLQKKNIIRSITAGNNIPSTSTSRILTETIHLNSNKDESYTDTDTVSIREEPEEQASIETVDDVSSLSSQSSYSSFKRQKTINESFSFLKSHATGGR